MDIHIKRLIDAKSCYETERKMRWSANIICPHCANDQVKKDGYDDTHKERQRYACRHCGKRFDDLTGTVFAGHH